MSLLTPTAASRCHKVEKIIVSRTFDRRRNRRQYTHTHARVRACARALRSRELPANGDLTPPVRRITISYNFQAKRNGREGSGRGLGGLLPTRSKDPKRRGQDAASACRVCRDMISSSTRDGFISRRERIGSNPSREFTSQSTSQYQ